MPARLAGDEPERDRGGVGERIVEVPDDPRQFLGELLRRDRDCVSVGAHGLRVAQGFLDLAEARLEADGERLEPRAVAGGQGADRGRVDAAGEQRAQRRVAVEMGGHGLLQRRADASLAAAARAGVRREAWPPEADVLRIGAGAHDQRVPRLERPDPGTDRLGRRDVAEREIAAQGLGVEVLAGRGQRLALRREAQLLAQARVEERLDAEAVAGQQQRARAAVPGGEGEHPPQPREHLRAVAAEELEQHLGVAGSAQLEAVGLELGAQLAVVVDLAVEDDPAGAVVRRHRLVARRRGVDDRQAPRAQRDVVVRQHALAVGAAVGEQARRFADPIGVGTAGEVDRPDDSAHDARALPGHPLTRAPA